MILEAKFGEANHQLYCDFTITAQPKKEIYGDYDVEITENGTTTLLTAGKFCDRDIDVNVNVASSGGSEVEDGLIDGTLSGHYRNDRVTSIRENAFEMFTSLPSVDFPNVTNIGDSAFSNCQKLSTANFPKVTTIGGNTFAGCYALTVADFPSLTSTGTYAFNNCKSVTVANFPKLTTLNEATLMNWNALPSIDLPSVTKISTNAFYNCYVLVSVVLRAETICTLSNTSAFKNCYHILGTVNAKYNPEGLKDGFIYVPDNLLEDYRQATNWSAFADQIKPISELEE